MCPSNGDEAAVQAFIAEHTDTVGTALNGATLPEGVLTCNAERVTCEANLTTCEAQPLSQPLTTGEVTAYGTGSDGDLQLGASRSYTDNGDGTITDNTTGLMWEKKSDDSSIHDKDNTYTWGMTSSPFTMNGTMVTTFLAALNAGSGFAGTPTGGFPIDSSWRVS